MKKNSFKKRIIFSLLLTIPFLVFVGLRIVNYIQYNQNCGGHLQLAADANTVDMAEKQLDIALKYLKDNKMTNGYTSILYKTPDEDVRFWYNNIKTSHDELKLISDTASNLEKSNMLLKLRETLIHHDKNGEEITQPAGISIYPNNTLYFWFCVLASILLFPLIITLGRAYFS